jgi:hypothetical protein
VTAELASWQVPTRDGDKKKRKLRGVDVSFRGTYAYVLGEGPDQRTAPEIQERTTAGAHAFGTR